MTGSGGGFYTLPVATSPTLGSVIVTTGLSASSGAYGIAAGTVAQSNGSSITAAVQVPGGTVAGMTAIQLSVWLGERRL